MTGTIEWDSTSAVAQSSPDGLAFDSCDADIKLVGQCSLGVQFETEEPCERKNAAREYRHQHCDRKRANNRARDRACDGGAHYRSATIPKR